MERFLGSNTQPGLRFSAIATVLIVLLASAFASAQTTYYSRATGNWNNANTWSTTGFGGAIDGGIPGALDIVNVGGGFSVNVSAAASCTTLNINDGSALTVAGVGLTVSGTTTIGNGISGSISFVTSNAGTKTFGPVVINNGATWTNLVNEGFTFNGGLTNNNASVINISAPSATLGTSSFGVSQSIVGDFAFFNLTVATGATLINTNSITVNNNLTVNGGTTFLNNGTVSAVASLGGAGSFTQGVGATLNISNSFTVTGISATANNNTVNYTGSGQVARNIAYYSLGFTGSGVANIPATITSIPGNFTVGSLVTLVATAGLSVGGDFTVAGSFNASTFSHAVGGNFTNTGTFLSMGLLTLNGASQSVGGSATSFGALTLAGTGTKTFVNQTSVSGSLTVNNGVNIDLNGLTTHSTNRLLLGGYIQPSGTWGTSASGAINQNNTFFTGTGTITAVSGNYTYFSRASGDWNNSSSWSTVSHVSSTNAGTYPQTGDYAVIGGGFVVTITGAETCEALLFDAGSGVTNTLLIGGSNSLSVTNSITIPQMATAGSNILNVGNGILTAPSLAFTSAAGGVAHQLSIGTGTVTISGNITGVGSASNITFTGAGLLRIGGSLFSSANGTLTSVAGSTVEYNGSGAQIVEAHSYPNLTVSGGNTKTLAASLTVAGNLNVADNTTLTVGAVTLQVNGATTIGGGTSGVINFTSTTGTKTFQGLVTVAAGATWNNAINEAVTYQGGITNNGTFNAGTGVQTFNTNSQNLNGVFTISSVTVTGATVVLTNNGTLTVPTALSGSGRLTQATGANLNVGGTSGITNMTATATGNTVNYTGVAQTVKNVQYHHLTLSGSGIKTLQVTTTTINGDLVLTGTVSATAVTNLTIAGNFDLGIGSTFAGSTFTINIAGSFINNGTFTSAGLINLNGAAQNLSGINTTFNNLTFSGSGVKSLGFEATVSGAFAINSGAVADLGTITTHNTNSIILNGAIQIAGIWGSTSSAAPLTNDTFFSNTGTITVASGDFTYYSRANGDWNDPATWSTVGHGSAVNAGTYPQASNYAIIGGGFSVVVTGAENCALLTFDAGTNVTNTLTIGGSNSLSVSGTVSIPQTITSGNNILDVGAGSINASTLAFTASAGGAGHQLNIGTGTATIAGNVTGIGAGSTIQFTGAGFFRVGGSLFTAANGTLISAIGSTVEYNGGGAQTVQAHAYNNLTVSGGNTKTLGATMTVAGNLNVSDNTTLAIGAITLIVNGATTVGSGVNGTLNITSTTGTKTFQGLVTVGTGAVWNNSANENVIFQGGINNTGTFNAGTSVQTFNTNSQSLVGTLVIPSVTVTGAAVVLTNTGTLTVNTALSGTGRLTQGAGATLIIGGLSAITNMTATASGNTVNYAGAAQTIKNIQYHNLTLSGSGAKTLTISTTSIAGNLILSGTASTIAVADLTIGGNFDIGLGTSFTGGTFAHNVGGNFVNNGTFSSAGNFNLTGNGQSLTGATTSFNNLSLQGSGTKTFGFEFAVGATLSVNSGVVADLGNFITHTANALVLNGAIQIAAGTWGSTTSGATNANDTYFSNIGIVTVATGFFTYYSRADGDWNDPNTWSTVGHGSPINSSGSYPLANDFAVVGGGNTVTVTADETCGNLSFDAGTSVTNTLSIGSGNTLDITGAVTIPQTVTSGLNNLNVGDGILLTPSVSFTATPGGAGHQVTIGTGTATVSGNISGVGGTSTIAFSGAGLLQVGGTFFSSANGTLTTVAGSTVEYNGSGAQTVEAHAYNNLTVSGGNVKTLAATMIIAGNLLVNDNTTLNVSAVTLTVNGTTTVGAGVSGTLNINSATGAKLFVGHVTIEAGATWNNSVNESIVFRGGITNDGTFTAGNGIHTFNTNLQALTGVFSIPNVTVTGAAVVLTNNGTLTVGTALAGTGRLTQGVGATLNIGGASTITNMTATASDNTVDYTGGAQTVRGINYHNLILSGTGVKTLQVGTTSIAGNFSLTSSVSATAVVGLTIGGAFEINAGNTFDAGNFTHAIGGDLTLDGDLIATSGTLNFNGLGNQNIQGLTETVFNNLSVSNTSGVVSVETNSNLAGTLTLGANTSFDADGAANSSIFTLLSTNDNPAADGNIAALPSSAVFNGNITVQRYMSAIDNIDRFISSPLSNATVAQLQDDFAITGNFTGTSFPCTGCNNNGASLRRYNETATGGTFRTGYTGVPASGGNSATTTLIPGVGYNPWMWNGVSAITWDLTGTINRNTINFTVSHTPSVPVRPTDDGWNLLGNPYPSAIQWRANGAGWTKSANIDPIVYVWDVIGNTWRTSDEAGVGNLTNGVIAMGQGFWVYVNSPGVGTLSVDESAKSLAGSGTYYRSRGLEADLLSVELRKQDVAVNAYLKVNNAATQEFDRGIDSPILELGIESMSVAFEEQGMRLAYMGVQRGFKHDIPLYVHAVEEGLYELNFQKTGNFGDLEGYSVVDLFTGEKTALTADLKLSFRHVNEAPKKRFVITRNTDAAYGMLADVQVYPNPTTGDVFVMMADASQVQEFTVMNTSGQLVADVSVGDWRVSQHTKAAVSLNNAPAGIYLIKLTTQRGVIVKRIVKY